jgi:hypothetical protein
MPEPPDDAVSKAPRHDPRRFRISAREGRQRVPHFSRPTAGKTANQGAMRAIVGADGWRALSGNSLTSA